MSIINRKKCKKCVLEFMPNVNKCPFCGGELVATVRYKVAILKILTNIS